MRSNNQSAYFSRHELELKVSGIEQTLEALYQTRFKNQFDTKIACYQECLLFITVTFNQRSISIPKAETGIIQLDNRKNIFRELERANYDVLKRILGNNLGRKKRLQPVLFAFVDFERTRTVKRTSECRNPHVHAIALVPPQIRLKYQVLLADGHGRDRTINTIDSVMVRQYDPGRASVPYLIDYCMKGLKSVPKHNAEWLEQVLPA